MKKGSISQESVFFINFKMVKTIVSLHSEVYQRIQKISSLFQGGTFFI